MCVSQCIFTYVTMLYYGVNTQDGTYLNLITYLKLNLDVDF